MDNQSLIILKNAILEFFEKLLPALPDTLVTYFSEFKEKLNLKTPSDVYEFAKNVPQLKKSDTISQNSSPEVPLNKIATCGYNPLQICNNKESDDKNQSGEKYQQLKIEINKNFFLKPTTKFESNQTTVEKNEKKVSIEAKVQRDNIKFVDTLKQIPKIQKTTFLERSGLLKQLNEALTQFSKDSQTLKAVYEKSTEINTPQTPNDQINQPQKYFYYQQFPQQQVCTFKEYSLYARNGYIKPAQFDIQFQQLQQQYQNHMIYKKLFF